MPAVSTQRQPASVSAPELRTRLERFDLWSLPDGERDGVEAAQGFLHSAHAAIESLQIILARECPSEARPDLNELLDMAEGAQGKVSSFLISFTEVLHHRQERLMFSMADKRRLSRLTGYTSDYARTIREASSRIPASMPEARLLWHSIGDNLEFVKRELKDIWPASA